MAYGAQTDLFPDFQYIFMPFFLATVNLCLNFGKMLCKK